MGAFAVLVAGFAPDVFAAETAAFAVDSFPCEGVVDEADADEGVDEGAETHFGRVGGVSGED